MWWEGVQGHIGGGIFSMNDLKDHVMYTRRENLNLKGVSRDYGAPFEGGGVVVSHRR